MIESLTVMLSHRITSSLATQGAYPDRVIPRSSYAASCVDSTEDEQAYERWFRAKVEVSLADPRPAMSHASVMADLDDIIDQAEHRSRPG